MASIRPNAKAKGATVARRRRRSTTRRRRRRSYRRNTATATANPPRRRRRRHTYTARRRRSYRRNPSMRGILGQVQENAVMALGVVGGKIVTRQIRSFVTPNKDAFGLLVEAAVATAVGVVGRRFVGTRMATALTVGGYAGIIEAVIQQSNVGFLKANLNDDGVTVMVPAAALSRSGLGGYARPGMLRSGARQGVSRLHGYPRATGGPGLPRDMNIMGI